VEKQNLLNIFIVWGFGTACAYEFEAEITQTEQQ